MSLFSSIPVRSNGHRAFASWWNVIRTALINVFGTGALGTTSFTVANNQGAAADVTGLAFTGAVSRSALVHYDIRRKTDTAASEVRERGTLTLLYNAQDSVWDTDANQSYAGAGAGVTFSVTTAGQVQYTSSSIAGSNYVGQMKFKAEAFDA